MSSKALLYLAALLPFAWGVAHLFPTKNVVNGFGDISADNQRIITMEWINEGAALIFVGILIATATFIDPTTPVSRVVYLLSFLFLNTLSAISLKTGAKIDFLPFRLCPLIFTGAAVLLLFGNLL